MKRKGYISKRDFQNAIIISENAWGFIGYLQAHLGYIDDETEKLFKDLIYREVWGK